MGEMVTSGFAYEVFDLTYLDGFDLNSHGTEINMKSDTTEDQINHVIE